MTLLPSDSEARRIVREVLDQTIFVPAGAGSGKTTNLIDRIVTILLSGAAGIHEIAAITFTETAAGELRDRLAEALERPAHDALAHQRATAALAGLDGAAISTLHGFARRILAEYPFAAGLPPVFDVTDEATAKAELEERWPEILLSLMDQEDVARAVQRLQTGGVRLDVIRSLAEKFNNEWDRIDLFRNATASLSRPAFTVVIDRIKEAVALRHHCSDPSDLLYGHLGKLVTLLEEVRSIDDEISLLAFFSKKEQRIKFGKGRTANWDGHKDDINDLLKDAEAMRDEIIADALEQATRVLAKALSELIHAEVKRRREDGHLQYHDLLVFARNLVRDNVTTRRSLHKRYPYILIDEFQDTDPLQAEIAAWIACDSQTGGAADQSWSELKIEPGRLFFVGDPVQSIYRFRRADISVFQEVQRKFATLEAPFTTNFRSVEGLVQWLNSVFEKLIGEGETPFQPPYKSAQQFRTVKDRPIAPVTVLSEEFDEKSRAGEIVEKEVGACAEWIARAHESALPVGDENRAVSYSDIAILIPRRRILLTLEPELRRRNIPYRLEASSLVYQSVEVQQLLSLLRAVDNPTNEMAVVSALRTPGCGCSDRQLALWRAAGLSFDYQLFDEDTGTLPQNCEEVVAAMARLRLLHEQRPFHSVAWTLGQIIDQFYAMESGFADERVREVWRRVRYLHDQARLFDENVGTDLRGFLSWVAVQEDEDARVTETVLPETDIDAVRILTVHAAKGLEFPVVVALGFGSKKPNVRYPSLYFDDEGVEVALSSRAKTHGFDGAQEVEDKHYEMERLRLLYVALTRARDYLVVTTYHKKKEETSSAARLKQVLNTFEKVTWATSFRELPAIVRESGPVSLKATHKGLGEERELFFENRKQQLERVPSLISATSVAKLATKQTQEVDEDETSAIERRLAAQRGRGATSFGRAVHGVLQEVDLPLGENIDVLARRHSAAEGIDERCDDIAAVARRAVASPLVQRAAASTLWRELYVGVTLNGHLLEGIIDLLYRDEAGLHVVDYKSDRVTTASDIDRLVSRYRLQGATYALAVEALLGEKVVDATFLFVSPLEPIEASVEDLDAACEQVRTLLAHDPR